MKALITAAEVKKKAESNETSFFVQADSIITPSAKDIAKDHGIQFVMDSEPSFVQNKYNCPSKPDQIPSPLLDPAAMAKIVEKVMSNLNPSIHPSQLVKEADPCGLRLAKGNSVVFESYETGNSQENIKIKELFNSRESSNMSAGFITLKETSYSTLIKRDEFNYIIKGTLECQVNSKKYLCEPGDTLFIPADTKVTYSALHDVKFLYVSSMNK